MDDEQGIEAVEAEAPAEAGEVETEPDLDDEKITLTDERAQAVFEARHLNGALQFARDQLAQSKVARLLNQHGLLAENQRKHDRQFVNDILQKRAAVETAKELVEKYVATGIPEPSVLEAATDEEVAAVEASKGGGA